MKSKEFDTGAVLCLLLVNACLVAIFWALAG
jgi:hypothetical protein